MLLHLTRQLAGDLDRAHLRAEGTAEGAFDEAGDLALDASEHTHGSPLGADPCYGTLARGPPERNAARHIPSSDGASATAAAGHRARAARWRRRHRPRPTVTRARRRSPPRWPTPTIAAHMIDADDVEDERAAPAPATAGSTAASAHTSAGASTPAEISGRNRWSTVADSELIQACGGGHAGHPRQVESLPGNRPRPKAARPSRSRPARPGATGWWRDRPRPARRRPGRSRRARARRR